MRVQVIFISVVCFLLGCTHGPGAEPPKTGISAEAGQKTIVIDVRTTAEYKAGHLQGTTNVPLAELQKRIQLVAPDKGGRVKVHCQSGGRSARAKTLLESLGYTNVEDLGSLSHARTVLDSPKVQ